MQETKPKIDINKKYKTRAGCPVRVLCTDRKGVEDRTSHVIALVTTKGYEEIRAYSKTGQYFIDEESALDLIEVQPWDDFKVDDPVLVRNLDSGTWNKRYFAGVNDQGKPLAFRDGCTSWSSGGDALEWNFCKKPDEK